jgi:reactive chlorine resistance protein C
MDAAWTPRPSTPEEVRMNSVFSTTVRDGSRELAPGALAGERLRRFESGLASAALVTLRYGLVLILVYFGAFKFTEVEAQGIEPMVRHSPFLGWSYAVASVRTVSAAIGVSEIAVAVAIALRAWSARVCLLGSLGAVGTFVVTLSFLFTTPGLWLEVPGFALPVPNELGAFVVKDVFLLGAALASAAEALTAWRQQVPR